MDFIVLVCLVNENIYLCFSLIKMVYNQSQRTKLVPSWSMIQYAVRRNFGGLDVGFDPVSIFRKYFDDFNAMDEQVEYKY